MGKGKVVNQWTCKDVELWLKGNGFDDYIELFSNEHKIDGRALLVLNEDDLRNPPLELKILGDIKRLWIAISTLQQRNNPTTSLAMPTGSIGYVIRNKIDQVDSLSRLMASSGKRRSRKFEDSDDERIDFIHPFSTISEKGRMFISLLYVSSAFFVTSFVAVFVVHDRVPDMKKYPPLPDIILDNLPVIPWAFKLSEGTVLILTAILFVVLFFHKHRVIVARRVAAMYGTLFLLRCVTMFVTSLSVPGVHLDCSGKVRRRNRLTILRIHSVMKIQGFFLISMFTSR